MSNKDDELDFGGLIFPEDSKDDVNVKSGNELSVVSASNELEEVKETAIDNVEDSTTKSDPFSNKLDIRNASSVAESDADSTIAVNSIKSELTDYKKDADSTDDAPVGIKSKLEEKKKNKKRKIRRIIVGIVAAILGLVIGVVGFIFWYKHYLYSQMEVIEAPVTIVDESGNTVYIADITETTQFEIIEDDDIHNFLLIGVDVRASGRDNWGNSDVNMIMSVNNSEGTIKMISIARDSYAYVPGYSNPMKINAAMAYGGPELLKATVENTLRITIDGYAFVNFYNMAGVIDAVGGVYVNATSSEVYAEHGLNWNLAELNNLSGMDPSYQAVNSTGDIWLNGRQAVAYARIRYVGNGDYERSERQVEVLRSLLNQFMAMSVTGKASAIDDVLALISTNISEADVTTYAFEFLPSMDNMSIQYMQLPIEGCFNSGMYGNEWSIRPNWNAMIPFVHEFFYGEQTEFDAVPDIPSSPTLENCPTLDDLTIEELMR